MLVALSMVAWPPDLVVVHVVLVLQSVSHWLQSSCWFFTGDCLVAGSCGSCFSSIGFSSIELFSCIVSYNRCLVDRIFLVDFSLATGRSHSSFGDCLVAELFVFFLVILH